MIDKQVIRDYLVTLAEQEIQIGDGDSLLASKLLDSLKVAELVIFLEDHYHISFEADELVPENLDSVNAIAAFLECKGMN
jgi:acyl carrier protein